MPRIDDTERRGMAWDARTLFLRLADDAEAVALGRDTTMSDATVAWLQRRAARLMRDYQTRQNGGDDA